MFASSQRSLLKLSRPRCLALVASVCWALSVPVAAQSTATAASRPSIGIIGAGQVGGAWGRLWAKAGYTVTFASRHPAELTELVHQAGPNAQAATVAQAIQHSQIIMLAVPYKAEPALAAQYGAQLKGKILIDADNAYLFRDGAIAAKARAAGVARYSQAMFPGTRFVRAFNSVDAITVADPSGGHGSVQVSYSSRDAGAGEVVAGLIRAAACVPVAGHEL